VQLFFWHCLSSTWAAIEIQVYIGSQQKRRSGKIAFSVAGG
jgi:hypothetical protein